MRVVIKHLGEDYSSAASDRANTVSPTSEVFIWNDPIPQVFINDSVVCITVIP